MVKRTQPNVKSQEHCIAFKTWIVQSLYWLADRLDSCGVVVRISQGRNISLLEGVQTASGAHSAIYTTPKGVKGRETLVGWWLVRQPERESKETFIGEVKNKWSFNSLPYTPSYWVQRQFQIFLYLPWIVNEYTSQPPVTNFTPFNIHYDSHLEHVVCLTF